jgi:hypothetical protein
MLQWQAEWRSTRFSGKDGYTEYIMFRGYSETLEADDKQQTINKSYKKFIHFFSGVGELTPIRRLTF